MVLCLDNLVVGEALAILTSLNLFFTVLFALEMVSKLIGMGPKEYVRDTFNIFDGVIVILSIVELLVDSGGSSETGTGN